MHIIIMADRLCFSGKIKDFRSLLTRLTDKKVKMADYLKSRRH